MRWESTISDCRCACARFDCYTGMLSTSNGLPVYAGSKEIEVEAFIVEKVNSVTRARKIEKLVISERSLEIFALGTPLPAGQL